MPKKVQVAHVTSASDCCGGSSGGSGTTTSGSSSSTAAALLSSKVEQIHTSVVSALGSRGRLGRGRRLGGGGCSALLLLLLDVLGDALLWSASWSVYSSAIRRDFRTHSQEVLDRSVGVVERRSHGRFDLTPLEAHGLHVGNGLGALSAHGEAGRVAALRTLRGIGIGIGICIGIGRALRRWRGRYGLLG